MAAAWYNQLIDGKNEHKTVLPLITTRVTNRDALITVVQ